jgi:hypothetical protein
MTATMRHSLLFTVLTAIAASTSSFIFPYNVSSSTSTVIELYAMPTFVPPARPCVQGGKGIHRPKKSPFKREDYGDGAWDED